MRVPSIVPGPQPAMVPTQKENFASSFTFRSPDELRIWLKKALVITAMKLFRAGLDHQVDHAALEIAEFGRGGLHFPTIRFRRVCSILRW